MDELGIIEAVGQLGAAGLIGLMWLSERRAAAARERQLEEAHAALRSSQVALRSVLEVVGRNTEALSAVRESQRAMARAIEKLARSERRAAAG